MSQDPGRTEWNREQLRSDDASRFEVRFARLARTEVHWLIPSEWFAPASSECRDMFRDGHFYVCISVAQAVGETLATKFLMGHHPAAESQPGDTCAEKLFGAGVITDACRLAFLRIRGDDRNDFHHLNKEVPTEAVKLEQRAEECVRDLYEIESEIFGCDISLQGIVTPRRPKYWRKVGENMMQVFMRQSY
jgi:hypothetical protein